MSLTSGLSNQSLTTHAAQLRADKTGEMFRSLEESLDEAIQRVQTSSGTERSESAARSLDKAFDAAKKILEKARSISVQRS
jgi:hypothetical protein